MSKGGLFLAMYVGGLVGMLMHFLKLKVKGQSAEEVLSYFKNNFKDTLSALLGTAFGVALIWATGDPANPIPLLLASVPAGFAFDSALNTSGRK